MPSTLKERRGCSTRIYRNHYSVDNALLFPSRGDTPPFRRTQRFDTNVILSLTHHSLETNNCLTLGADGVVGAHAKALALHDGRFVGLLVPSGLGFVVVLLGEATGDVAFRGGLDVQDDQERGGDDDEQRGGDDAEDVDIRERELLELLRGERGGGKRRNGGGGHRGRDGLAHSLDGRGSGGRAGGDGGDLCEGMREASRSRDTDGGQRK